MVEFNRFGGGSTQTLTGEVSPEDIAKQPEIPQRRFGRGVERSKALQERAIQLRRIRSQAKEEAARLEREFFSKKITIEQAEEGFSQVDPLVRQFITTTPAVRRARAAAVVKGIQDRIAKERADIQNLRSRLGTAPNREELERTIIFKQDFIDQLGNFIDDAQTGAFTLSDIISAAQIRPEARQQRLQQRQEGVTEQTQALESEGIRPEVAQEIVRSGRIDPNLARGLSERTKDVLGVRETVTIRDVPAQQLPGIIIRDPVPTAQQKFNVTADILQLKLSKTTPIVAVPVSFGLGVLEPAGRAIAFGEDIVTSPRRTTRQIVSSTKEFFSDVPGSLAELGGRAGTKAVTQPERFAGNIVGEIAILKGTGKILSFGEDIFDVGRTIISPKFRAILPDADDLSKVGRAAGTTGKSIRGVGLEGGRKVDIPIAKPVKDITIPLTEQIKLADDVTDVVSAQTNFFTNFKTNVNLERTFFGDPFGRLRVSRFSGQREATFLDIIRGDITIKKQRPQAFIFPDAEIEKLPASLADVERSLRTGKTLTPSQIQRFTKFQETPSGKFKPIGFLSTEPEVIAPAGDIIRKRSTRAVTLFGLKRVEVIEAELAKGTTPATPPKPFVSPTRSILSPTVSSVKSPDVPTISPGSISQPRVSRPTSPRSILSPRSSLGSLSFTSGLKSISPRSPTVKSPKTSIPPLTPSLISPPSRTPSISILSPPIRTPKSPPFTPPGRPPAEPFRRLPRIKTRKLRRKRRRISGFTDDIAFAQGFTARSLGLKPITVTRAQLPKLPQQSPIGIRRGVILREARRRR